ncbi:MAG: hypothetical protein R3C32_04040 [Chloroflexota bacterium]
MRYSSLSPGRGRTTRLVAGPGGICRSLFAAAIAALVVALARPAAVVSVPTSKTTILLVAGCVAEHVLDRHRAKSA